MSTAIKILVADDESIGRQLLEAILMPEGYDIVFGSDGKEAIEVANREIPDIILLDVMMPFFDGFEVCKKIRENKNTAHIPVYLITALDDRDSRIRGIDAGADDYISKPFDRVEILGKIKNKTNLIQNQKNKPSASAPLSIKEEKSTSGANPSLLNALFKKIFTIPTLNSQLSISQTSDASKSQHAFIHEKLGNTEYYLLCSNLLKAEESVLANALLCQIWKNTILNPEIDSSLSIPKCMVDLNALIKDEALDSLTKAGFSIVQIYHEEETREIKVSGLNQNVFLFQKENALTPGLPPAYQSFYLQGNQELKFSSPGNLLLITSNILTNSNQQDFLNYLNSEVQNMPTEEIVIQIHKKYCEVDDCVIVNYHF